MYFLQEITCVLLEQLNTQAGNEKQSYFSFQLNSALEYVSKSLHLMITPPELERSKAYFISPCFNALSLSLPELEGTSSFCLSCLMQSVIFYS